MEVSIAEIRKTTGMSQSAFAKFFDIPVRTLQDWEQERRVPPPYVPGMMLRILKHEFVGKSKKRTDKGADNSANQGEKVRKGAGE